MLFMHAVGDYTRAIIASEPTHVSYPTRVTVKWLVSQSYNPTHFSSRL